RPAGGKPGSSSSVDRAHTALHGYPRAACIECGITISENETFTALLKRLRESHPRLRDLGPRPDNTMKVLECLALLRMRSTRCGMTQALHIPTTSCCHRQRRCLS